MDADTLVCVVRVRLAALAAMAGQGGTVAWSQAWRAIEPLTVSADQPPAYTQPWIAIAEATHAAVATAVAESRRRALRGDRDCDRDRAAAEVAPRPPGSDRPAGFRRRCC